MKRMIVLSIVLSIATLTNAAHFYIPAGDVAALKAAIITANTNNAADTIHLYPYSTYKFTTIDHVFVFVANVLPRIAYDGNVSNSLTILGNGAKLVMDRVATGDARFLYLEDCTVKIYDLGFFNGRVDYDDYNGGALYVAGGASDRTVELYNCLFQGNAAFLGGAIYNSAGNMNIDNCTFTQNDGMFMGGAIYNFAGTVWIRNSVIVNNIGTNNSSESTRGAIVNQSNLFSPNPFQILLVNSIIAKNTFQSVGSPDHGKEYDVATNSAIYTLGYNLIGAHNNSSTGSLPAILSCTPCVNQDYVGTPTGIIDPMLSALERRYDYQDTYEILPGSLALMNNAGYDNQPVPDIASYGIFPGFAEEGEEITLYGKNLSEIVKITFEGAEVTNGFTKTDTSLVVTVPVGALTGKLTVETLDLESEASHQIFTVGEEPGPVTGTDPEVAQSEFSFYPNPTSGYLTVKSNGNTFSISDFMGRKLLTSNIEQIDVSIFPQGVYLIKCGKSVKRFIKQ